MLDRTFTMTDSTQPPSPDRHLRLDGGSNFRDFGGYGTADGRAVRPRRLFRSGALGQLTPADIERLDQLGVRHIIDLRCPPERELVPTRWRTPRIHAFDYPFEDVFAPALGMHNERMYESFLSLLVPHMRALFDVLLRDEAPVVVHCSAGQDRTGVVVAVLLRALGVDAPTVAADYLQTTALRRRENEMDLARVLPLAHANPVAAFYARVVAEHGTAVLEPRPLLQRDGRPKILLTLDAIERGWGSVESYLEKECALKDGALRDLRARYLETPAPDKPAQIAQEKQSDGCEEARPSAMTGVD